MADLFGFDDGDEGRRARKRRDEGMGLAAEHSKEWLVGVMGWIEWELPHGWVGISEDFRLEIEGSELGKPHDPHVWGSVTKLAVERGLLVPTGRWRHMRGPLSNARITREYRRV